MNADTVASVGSGTDDRSGKLGTAGDAVFEEETSDTDAKQHHDRLQHSAKQVMPHPLKLPFK